MNTFLHQMQPMITPDIMASASRILSEDENKIRKSFEGIFPALLFSLTQVDESKFHALNELIGKAGTQHLEAHDIINNLNIVRSDKPVSTGDHLIKTVLGEKAPGLVNMISNFSGIKPSNSNSLLSIGGTILSAIVGRTMLSEGLNFSTLVQNMSAQSQSIESMMPEGMASFLRTPILPNNDSVLKNQTKKSDSLKWVLPLILIALLGIGLWWWMNGRQSNKEENKQDEAVIDSAGASISSAFDSAAATQVAVSPDTSEGKLDASGNWLKRKGEAIKIKLPNGIILDGHKGGFEDHLFNFINDPTAIAGKEVWFDFEDVLFESGKSSLKSGYEKQLQNLVDILKAYPKVLVKLGGYTDNVGDTTQNIKLSEARARTVYQKLISMGADKAMFEDPKPFEGYGPFHPKEDNTTDLGRAQNRRIAVSVRTK
jgi:outer membrane protein OmpA-like peptidoglycan-associated protein